MERVAVVEPKKVEPNSSLVSADFMALQMVVDGWKEVESERIGINLTDCKRIIVDKMTGDESLSVFLAGDRSLPFFPENAFSPKEAMVQSLLQLGLRNREVCSILEITHAEVQTYKRRIAKKMEEGKHKDVPQIELGDNFETGLVKGIFCALQDEQINTEIINREPKAILSYQESRVLFLMCGGLGTASVAAQLGKPETTVSTYIKRIKKKLGLTKEYQIIAKGLNEMILQQRRELSIAAGI